MTRSGRIATATHDSLDSRIPWLTGRRLEIGVLALVIAVIAALLLPLYDAPAIGSDSGNILSIARLTFESGLQPMLDRQAPPLTLLVYGIMLGSPIPLNLGPVLTAFLLMLFLAFVVYKETKSYLVAAVPVLILASSRTFWLQNTSLSPYAAFVLLGYAGLYVGSRYVLQRADLRAGVLGAFLVAASLYTFGQALPYLVLPALLLILSPNKETLQRLARFYAVLFLLILPWVITHLAVGGLLEFHHYPRSWLGSEYGEYIRDFWGRTYYDSPMLYLTTTFRMVVYYTLPEWGWPLLAGSLYLIHRHYGGRVLLFVACVALVFTLPVLIAKSPTFPRYWYSLLPLCALVIAAGANEVMRRVPRSTLAWGLGAVLVASLVSTLIARSEAYDSNIAKEISAQRDLERFAALIEDNRGIVSRDARIQSLTPNNQTYNNLLMSQEDFVVYLTWPDDATVADVFADYGIGWVLLYNDTQRWEVEYNAWLDEAAGQMPAHHQRIRDSALVSSVYPGEAYTLYRLKER